MQQYGSVRTPARQCQQAQQHTKEPAAASAKTRRPSSVFFCLALIGPHTHTHTPPRAREVQRSTLFCARYENKYSTPSQINARACLYGSSRHDEDDAQHNNTHDKQQKTHFFFSFPLFFWCFLRKKNKKNDKKFGNEIKGVSPTTA
jgi:hypothetical protein